MLALLSLEASGLMQGARPPEHALMLMAFLAHVYDWLHPRFRSLKSTGGPTASTVPVK